METHGLLSPMMMLLTKVELPVLVPIGALDLWRHKRILDPRLLIDTVPPSTLYLDFSSLPLLFPAILVLTLIPLPYNA